MMDSRTLHRAAWILPVSFPPIEDGAVLMERDSILAVGKYRQLKNASGTGTTFVDHGSAAILPGLVNVHTHLELSALRGRIPLPQPGFSSWLRELFAHRGFIDQREEYRAVENGEREILEGGSCLFGDLTNGAFVAEAKKDVYPVKVLFLELLGFDSVNMESVVGPEIAAFMEGSPQEESMLTLAAHACYSTSPEVIRKTKEWCRSRKLPFSIHVAEHLDEIEFLQTGGGFCREVLEALDKWVDSWIPPQMTPVEYLDHLGVLDSQTIVVHAVHMTRSDWEILAARRCHVCFCPRSNFYLNVGQPDIHSCLRLGIPAAIGTDSLASNVDLNMFEEAAFALDHQPHLDPESLLFMMTLGGARALRMERYFGSIEPGKKTPLLAISLAADCAPSRLYQNVLLNGQKGEWRWINCH